MTKPWTVVSIDRVIDGDTVRLTRQRDVAEVDGLTLSARDTRPVSVRLVHVDTPERGEEGWAYARDDLQRWLGRWSASEYTLHDAGRDNFGRVLGDLHAPDGDSATLHMVQTGWPTWMETR